MENCQRCGRPLRAYNSRISGYGKTCRKIVNDTPALPGIDAPQDTSTQLETYSSRTTRVVLRSILDKIRGIFSAIYGALYGPNSNAETRYAIQDEILGRRKP